MGMTHPVQASPLLFEPGDRLTLDDFLARWEKMPDLKFAELIDGVVYMPSPLSYEHGGRDAQIQMLLGVYAARTRVCETVSNATWLMSGSAPQPDAALRLFPEFGGRTNVAGKLAAGAPELVVEVCLSTRSFDLGPKLGLYRRAGVLEYVIALLEEQRIERRSLDAGNYRLIPADDSGVLRSAAFPGLWLDERALWARDGGWLLEVLEAGIQSEECRNFLHRVRSL